MTIPTVNIAKYPFILNEPPPPSSKKRVELSSVAPGKHGSEVVTAGSEYDSVSVESPILCDEDHVA